MLVVVKTGIDDLGWLVLAVVKTEIDDPGWLMLAVVLPVHEGVSQDLRGAGLEVEQGAR